MSPPRHNLAPGAYALLGERSESDSTIVMGHAYSPTLRRDPDLMTEDEWGQWTIECERDGAKEWTAWFEWRVRFEDAEKLHTTVDGLTDFACKLYREDCVAAWSDQRGVLRFDAAFEAFIRESTASGEEDDG